MLLSGAGDEAIARLPAQVDQRWQSGSQIEGLVVAGIAGRVDPRRPPQARHVGVVLAIGVGRSRGPVVGDEIKDARVELEDGLIGSDGNQCAGAMGWHALALAGR